MVSWQWDQTTGLIPFFTHILVVKKPPVPPRTEFVVLFIKNGLDEAVKIIDFLSSRPLTTLFSAFRRDWTGSEHTEVWRWPENRAPVPWLVLWAERSACFPWSTVSRWRSNGQRSHGPPFLKDKQSNWLLELWETCICFHELDSFPMLWGQTFLMKWEVTLTNVIFLILCNFIRCVNIWKTHLSQWTNICLPNDQSYKLMFQ